MIRPTPTEETVDNPLKDEGPVERLMRLTATAGLLRSTDDRFYAQVKVGCRREIYELKSAAFRHWLIDGYYRDCRRLPSGWAIRRILDSLEAIARFEGGTSSIFIRVGHDGNSNGHGSLCYLDLGDPSGQAIQIGSGGWSVVNDPRVHFRRPAGHLPLPTPSREGSIELLRPYVNLSEQDFRLLVVWLAAALQPIGPYPILALYGEQGSAKSTLARVVRLLIDPQAAPLLAEPQNTRDLMVTAVNGWLLAYDNIGAIPDWMSDGLCRLSTAGAFAGRASFTDGERSVIHAQRPVILNGIDEFVRRGDLSDRSIFLDLPPIAPSERRREAEFWVAFHQDYPRILGGLLDAVVGGLQELPSVRLRESPRMADFTAFAEAVGRKLGWPAGTVLSDYNDNRRQATLDHIEDSPLASCLLEITTHRPDWIRTATDLLAELTPIVAKRVAASPRWPKSSLALSRELRRIAPQLRLHGISIVFQRAPDRRFITITRTNRPKTEASSHVSVDEIGSCFDELAEGENRVANLTPLPVTG